MKKLGSFPTHLQSQIDEITTILLKHTKRAYFVGGCIRDIYLHNQIKDIDIEVYDISPNEFDTLMKSIGALGVGKSFFVYKYKELDLALPRIERKTGVGHKAFEVELCEDEKEASKRRDFSMNALMMNIFNGEVLDFWAGLEAIEKKEIKHIDTTAFKEDSLRVLRAVQFASRFDFSIDEKTLHVMREISLEDLSATRVFWELEKFFKARYLHVGLKYFYELGLFERIFGLHVSYEDYKNIEQEIKEAKFLEHLKEYYFIYIVSSVLKIEPIEMIKKLEAPNLYVKIFKYQPYFDKMPSDFELFEIAMIKPIKDWLGNYKEKVVKKAKELDIYEEVYTGGILIADVIKDGFEKEDIRKEFDRRVLETIRREFYNELLHT